MLNKIWGGFFFLAFAVGVVKTVLPRLGAGHLGHGLGHAPRHGVRIELAGADTPFPAGVEVDRRQSYGVTATST